MRHFSTSIIILFSVLLASCRTLPPPAEAPSPVPANTPPPATPKPSPTPTASPGEIVRPFEPAVPLEMEILVHSDKSGTNQIYILDCLSGEMRQLTDGDADNCFASWASDRERIAFTSDRDGNREVYLADQDGEALERITDNPEPDTFPVWSPDDSFLAFFSQSSGVDNLELYDLSGGNSRTLTEFSEGSGGAIVFSPDGSKIFFGYDRMGRYKIYQLELSGGEPRELITNAMRNSRMTCLDDPEGLALLYVSGAAGQDDIWLSFVDDGRFVNITRDPAPDHSPTLSPAGESVIFSSLRDGDNWQIYLVSRAGRPIENRVIRITDDEFNYWYPHVR